MDDYNNQSLQYENKYTLMININLEKEKKVKNLLKHKEKQNQNQKKISKREKMMKNGFNFIQKGSFMKNLQNRIKEEQKKNQNKEQINEENKINKIHNNELSNNFLNIDNSNISLQIYNNIKPKYNKNNISLTFHEQIPEVENWDKIFLPQKMTNFLPNDMNLDDNLTIEKIENYFNSNNYLTNFIYSKLNSYVDHPVKIKNEIIEKEKKIQNETNLTLKEKKKLLHQKRMRISNDEREQIKLGLKQPKPPKITEKNKLNLLKEKFVSPTEIDIYVKKQYELRKKKMLEENEKRKLTKEQKKEKIKKKFEKDLKDGTYASLFKIKYLTSDKNRFKIDKNSQQLYLTGLCLMNRENTLNNLLYVEGGYKAIQRFKKLVLSRIKWNETEKDLVNQKLSLKNDDEKNKENNNINNCKLLWEGSVRKRIWGKWKMREIKSEQDAIAILKEKNMEYIWNMIKNS